MSEPGERAPDGPSEDFINPMEAYVRNGADFICSYPPPSWPTEPTERSGCSFICIVGEKEAAQVRGCTEGTDTVLMEDTPASPTGPFSTEKVVGRGNLMLAPDGSLMLVANGRSVPVLAAAMDEEETHGSRVRQLYLAHHFTDTVGQLVQQRSAAMTHAAMADYQRMLDFNAATMSSVAAMVGERAEAWARRAETVTAPTEAMSLLTVPKMPGKTGLAGGRRAVEKRLRVDRVGTQSMKVRLGMSHSRAKSLAGKSTNIKRVAPLAIEPTLWASTVEDGNYLTALAQEVALHFRGFRLRAWMAWLCVVAASEATGVPTSEMGSREALTKVRALLQNNRSRLSDAEGQEVRSVLKAMESGFLHVEREGAADELIPLLVDVAHQAEQTDGGLVPGVATRLALNPLLQSDYRHGRGVTMAAMLLSIADDVTLSIAASAATHVSLDRKTSPSTVGLLKWLERIGILEWMEAKVSHDGQGAAIRELERRIQALAAWPDGQGGTVDLVGGLLLEVCEGDWRRSRVRWGAAPLVLTVSRSALPAPVTDSQPPAVSEPAPVS